MQCFGSLTLMVQLVSYIVDVIFILIELSPQLVRPRILSTIDSFIYIFTSFASRDNQCSTKVGNCTLELTLSCLSWKRKLSSMFINPPKSQ